MLAPIFQVAESILVVQTRPTLRTIIVLPIAVQWRLMTQLKIPSFDFPTELSFNVYASNQGDGETATVSYSTNGGGWQAPSSFTVSKPGNVESIDLTSLPELSGETNVRFRFEFDFNAWYLDDVTITGASGPGFVAGYEDLAVGDASYYAVDGLDPNTDYYFCVRAENLDGTSPNSATGMITTTVTGTPYYVWATENGVAPADINSNFDNDGLTDFEEYLLASDPDDSASQPALTQTSLIDELFQVIHRRSLAPEIIWDYLGDNSLPLSQTPLSAGAAYREYEIVSVERFDNYDLVTLSINIGLDDSFFFSIRATETQ